VTETDRSLGSQVRRWADGRREGAQPVWAGARYLWNVTARTADIGAAAVVLALVAAVPAALGGTLGGMTCETETPDVGSSIA
jgi:hypothetical protein